jgi:thioesterase domain-containing protein
MVALRETGRGLPLFCVPGARDYGFGLRALAERLDDRPVHSFSFERWGPTGVLGMTLPEAAALFVAECRRVRPHGPYHLLGYCSGGWIVFEAARQLLAAGEDVATLTLVDSFGPPFSGLASVSRAERLRQVWWWFRGLPFGSKLSFVLRRLHPEKLAAKLLGRFGPPLPATASDGKRDKDDAADVISGSYLARPLPLRIDVIGSAVQPAWYRAYGQNAPDLGWSGFAAKGTRSHTIRGVRDSALKEPAVAELAKAVRGVLEGA